MHKKLLLSLASISLLALTACGGDDSKSESSSQESTSSAASASASASETASATPTESETASASASSTASSSASSSASASATKGAAAADAKGNEVTLTVKTDGTAEFDHNDSGSLVTDDISKGFTETYTLDPSNGTAYFTINADSKKFTATEVACELTYNGKVIASATSADRGAVKVTCGVTGDINTMAEVPSKIK